VTPGSAALEADEIVHLGWNEVAVVSVREARYYTNMMQGGGNWRVYQ